MKKNKLLLVDVDGVLTTGRKTYGSDGMPMSKEFFDKDFTALKEFTACGFRVIWISGDDFINKEVAKNRNYEFISARNKDKGEITSRLLQKSEVKYEYIITIGDDLFDIGILPYVNKFYIPSNAHWRIKEKVDVEDRIHLLETKGGYGAVVEMSQFELSNNTFEEVLKGIVDLDQKEKF